MDEFLRWFNGIDSVTSLTANIILLMPYPAILVLYLKKWILVPLNKRYFYGVYGDENAQFEFFRAIAKARMSAMLGTRVGLNDATNTYRQALEFYEALKEIPGDMPEEVEFEVIDAFRSLGDVQLSQQGHTEEIDRKRIRQSAIEYYEECLDKWEKYETNNGDAGAFAAKSKSECHKGLGVTRCRNAGVRIMADDFNTCKVAPESRTSLSTEDEAEMSKARTHFDHIKELTTSPTLMEFVEGTADAILKYALKEEMFENSPDQKMLWGKLTRSGVAP